jgi:hypothetical protein
MEKEIKINFEVIPSYEKLNDIEKILFDKAKTIREQAYAPYSWSAVRFCWKMAKSSQGAIRKMPRIHPDFVRKEPQFFGLRPIILT